MERPNFASDLPVLIFEDDRDLTDLLEIHLNDLGYEADVAFDGETGLQKDSGTARQHAVCRERAWARYDVLVHAAGGASVRDAANGVMREVASWTADG
jgi:hypothetical protein